MTPRAALLNVMPGRAGCVSFYRPDDIDHIEAVCPRVMLDNGAFSFWQQAIRAGNEWAEERDWTPFLPVDRAASDRRAMGSHPRYARSAKPAQRRDAERMAVRSMGSAAVAHGRPAGEVGQAVRPIRARLHRVDRRGQNGCGRVRCLHGAHGRGCGVSRQSMAGAAHDARHDGRAAFPLQQRGQHVSSAERVAI